MILRREQLGQHPAVFRSMTGLTVGTFDAMLPDLLAGFAADRRRRRLDRPDRRRAQGGGDAFDLGVADQFLLTVVWLRHYPTQECFGYLFGVSDSTALRAVRRCLPALEAQGKDTMRLPDPGRGKRRDLPALLKQTPSSRGRSGPRGGSAPTIPARRSRTRSRARWPSMRTAGSPMSGLAGRLARSEVGALGDLAYVGIDGLVRGLRGAT